jgi:hypothetical protein
LETLIPISGDQESFFHDVEGSKTAAESPTIVFSPLGAKERRVECCCNAGAERTNRWEESREEPEEDDGDWEAREES